MDSIRQRKSGKEKLLSNSISSGFSEILIFMIVNPISGSNEGVAYTQLNKSNFDFTVGDGINVNLKIANLVEEGQVDDVKEEISGLLNARAQSSKSRDNIGNDERLIVVLICAGDGTFMNIAQEFKEYGIQIEKLVFAVFPFGTANDISRNCGWGVVPSDRMLESIEYVCELIASSRESGFDVWEVEVHTREDGDVHKPKDGVLVSMETT